MNPGAPREEENWYSIWPNQEKRQQSVRLLLRTFTHLPSTLLRTTRLSHSIYVQCLSLRATEAPTKIKHAEVNVDDVEAASQDS